MKISNFYTRFPNVLTYHEIWPAGVYSAVYLAFEDILEDSLINDSMKAEIIVTLIRLRSYSI